MPRLGCHHSVAPVWLAAKQLQSCGVTIDHPLLDRGNLWEDSSAVAKYSKPLKGWQTHLSLGSAQPSCSHRDCGGKTGSHTVMRFFGLISLPK